MKEEILQFGPGNELVGIVTVPPEHVRDPRLPGVVLLTAGLVSRVGPNRLYVTIARALAELGFTVLRFDFSGIGDSHPRIDQLPLVESGVRDTVDAMTWLGLGWGVERFILMGHCSGAWFSLITAAIGAPHVVGAVAMNPDPVVEDWTSYDRQRKMSQFYRTYYTRGAIGDAEKWRRFVRGQVDYRSIARNILHRVVADTLAVGAFQLKNKLLAKGGVTIDTPEQHVADWVTGLLYELARLEVRVTILHPQGSTGSEFLEYVSGEALAELQRVGSLRFERLPHTDHVYTLKASQAALLDILRDTVRSMVPAV
jgi:pimeloyl-ACP methyl ester carboxylesterase